MKIRERTPNPEKKRDYTVITAIISATAVIAAALIAILPNLLNKPATPTPIQDAPVATVAASATDITNPTPTLEIPLSASAETPIGFVQQLPIYKAEASSEAGCPQYCGANKVFDEYTGYGGGWASAVGDGIGAWIRLYMPESHTITQLKIFLDIPAVNILDQLKDVTLTFEDGTTYDVHFPYQDGWQTIDIPPTNTSAIQITVIDVYPSETYPERHAVEVMEIQLYGTN